MYRSLSLHPMAIQLRLYLIDILMVLTSSARHQHHNHHSITACNQSVYAFRSSILHIASHTLFLLYCPDQCISSSIISCFMRMRLLFLHSTLAKGQLANIQVNHQANVEAYKEEEYCHV